ncbi:MAG TPA: hypothetical protein VFQ61_01920 [Polyangiaceae bacterium]|nr:hypothetical protein [Polyangiaceae bacterium]
MIRSVLAPRSIRRLALTTALVIVAACSRQGEGERCDSTVNGNADCEGDLQCKAHGSLATGDVDRCCPPGSLFNDVRCTPGSGVSTGTGGNTNGSGGDTSSEGGATSSESGGSTSAASGGDTSSTASGGASTATTETSGGQMSQAGSSSES